MKLSPLAEMNDEDFEAIVNINLTGTFRGVREGGKRLRDGGRIINFSSSVVGMYQRPTAPMPRRNPPSKP